jgi:hypothetical protein
MMWARDAFGLTVRIVGLISLVYGSFDGFGVIAKLLGIEYGSTHTLASVLMAMIFFAMMGFFPLMKAD